MAFIKLAEMGRIFKTEFKADLFNVFSSKQTESSCFKYNTILYVILGRLSNGVP